MSVRPLVEGQEMSWRDFAFVESNYWGRALIFDRYKYVCEYVPHGTEADLIPPGPDPERIGLEQVFDLETDPYETQNLAFDWDKRELVLGFRRVLLDFEARLHRRQLVEPAPVQQVDRWGKRIRAYWDSHPDLEASRIRV